MSDVAVFPKNGAAIQILQDQIANLRDQQQRNGGSATDPLTNNLYYDEIGSLEDSVQVLKADDIRYATNSKRARKRT